MPSRRFFPLFLFTSFLVAESFGQVTTREYFAEFFAPSQEKGANLDPDRLFPQGRIFPISFFSVGAAASARTEEGLHDLLQRYRKDGFTAIGPQYERNDRILEEASRYDLKAIYSLGIGKPQIVAGELTAEEIQENIRQQVEQVMDDPAIGWWYILPEELRYWRPAEIGYLELAANTIRETDPLRRPVWMYDPGHRNAEHLKHTARWLDVVGKGMYTNYSGRMNERIWCRWTIEQELLAIKEANPGAIAIAVPEAFKHPNDYDPRFAGNEEEALAAIGSWVRHDAYLALISGAQGMVIFSMRERPQGLDFGGGALPFTGKVYETYYNAYADIAGALTGDLNLGSILLFGERRDHLKIRVVGGPETVSMAFPAGRVDEPVVYPSVSHLDVAYGHDRYLFLVNSSESPAKLIIEGLPYGSDIQVRDLLTGAPAYTVPEGDFPVELPGLGVGIFRISATGNLSRQRSARRQLEEGNVPFDGAEFMRRAAIGDAAIVRLFLEAGMDVDLRGAGGTSALMWAAGENQLEVIDVLLDWRAGLDHCDSDFWTALMWARQAGHKDAVRRLQQAGAVIGHTLFDRDES